MNIDSMVLPIGHYYKGIDSLILSHVSDGEFAGLPWRRLESESNG